MFKKRIRKWGLDNKHIRSNEAHQVILLKRQRDAVGKKDHRILVRGRRIEWANIQQHLARNPRLQAKVNASSGQLEIGSSVDGVVVRTPSPDLAIGLTVPPPIVADDDFRTAEEIGRILRDYIAGGIDSGLWTVHRDHLLRSPSRYDRCRRWSDAGERCMGLIGAAEFQVGFRLLSRWLDLTRQILREQEFRTVRDFLRIFIHYFWNYFVDERLIQVIGKHLAELTAIELGRNHPLSLALTRLQGASEKCRDILVDSALDAVFEPSQAILGEGSIQMFDMQMGIKFGVRGDEAQARGITSLLAGCKPWETQRRFRLELSLALALAGPSNIREAGEALVRARRYACCGSGEEDLSPVDRFSFGWVAGQVHWYCGRLSEALEACRELVEFCTAVFGPDHRRTVNVLGFHCEVLRTMGRNEEAAQVAAEMEQSEGRTADPYLLLT